MDGNGYGSVELQRVGQMQNDAKREIARENPSTGNKKVTQMKRRTASLTFFTARLGMISVMKNTSSDVQVRVLQLRIVGVLRTLDTRRRNTHRLKWMMPLVHPALLKGFLLKTTTETLNSSYAWLVPG